MSRQYYVYLLASKRNGTLYIGVTNDVRRRVEEHRLQHGASFTARYGVVRLVWCEALDDIRLALQREKQIKKWNRAWKLRLIEESNPEWNDLMPEAEAGNTP